MRILWLIAALLIAAAGVALFTDNMKISMLLLIVGSILNLVDRYLERRQ